MINLKAIFLSLVFFSCCLLTSCQTNSDEVLQELEITQRTHELRAKYDDKILNIAYSSLDDGYPINTYEHFKFAIKSGFNSLKTDLRLTSDRKLILCHDAGFTLDKDGRITTFDASNCKLIHDMTSDEILALEHLNFASRLGYYAHPIALETYLDLCTEYNVIPYLTIRNEFQVETVKYLFDQLRKRNLVDKCIINVYPPSIATVNAIRAMSEDVSICFTLNNNEILSKSKIDEVNKMGNAFVDISYQTADVILEDVWSYAKEKDVRIFAWGVRTKDVYLYLIKKGCKGFQITRLNCIPTEEELLQ